MTKCCYMQQRPEAHSELSQTSKMGLFAESCQITFTLNFMLDVSLGSEYASEV